MTVVFAEDSWGTIEDTPKLYKGHDPKVSIVVWIFIVFQSPYVVLGLQPLSFPAPLGGVPSPFRDILSFLA